MGCSKPAESLPASKRKRAIEEITKGLQLANQLRSLLNDSLEDDVSAPAKDLIFKVLSSFTNSLTILSSDDVSQLQANAHGHKSESSRGSCRNDISTIKDRRGRYKRRKNLQVWIRDTPCLIDDGHAWRKYGQKVILNAEHPRHYYKCTHKSDQRCRAIKHVQIIQKDPPKYRTTYIGHHTCKTFLYDPRSISDPASEDSPFVLESFDCTITAGEQNHLFTSYFPSTKQEHKEEKTSSNPINPKQSSSSPDYDLLSPSHTTFDSFDYEAIFSEFGIGDVIPGVMDMGLDFEDDISLPF
ncbi:putative WRKY transcription factor 70 [Morella rubra]|uniref:Putative WRKY transcription factor 70 n=1 Tax=Morella rubra TaxID=262757 RepID=A0A6A1WH96_9ROSI|nr:putative WRKY transcription factor 70 [Morella rubra]